MLNNTFKVLLITLVVSSLLTIGFFFFMKHVISRQEQFSEVYFENPDELPRKLSVNGTYNVSFTVTNNELSPVNYTYEVSSQAQDLKENITLLPGEKSLITLSVSPEDKYWIVNFTYVAGFEDELSPMDYAFLSGDENLNLLIDNKTRSGTPLSHFLPGFGFVYHTNLTIEELSRKPFNKFLSNKIVNESYSTQWTQNVTLYAEDGVVRARVHETRETLITEKHPFTIRFYKQTEKSDEKREIYFWYEVV